jgi:hypothetical protein
MIDMDRVELSHNKLPQKGSKSRNTPNWDVLVFFETPIVLFVSIISSDILTSTTT